MIRPVTVLPSDLVNQIAAGEVIERPASVVKELVENAMDAGARTIDIVLQNGGRKSIEVSDDGSGMSPENARLALERHATSKIATFDDLLSISTLGFRGEALPSIASVSRFSLLTFDGDSSHAVEVGNATGSIEVRPAARDRGTTVRVADLFENVPARRKFLKSADAEFRAIAALVFSYALASPERAFRVSNNGRVVIDLPSVATLRERVLQVLGNETDATLSEIDRETGGCRVSGFVTRGLRWGSRRHQYFFVNGRAVRDRVLTHAANRAADAFDFDGYPAVVLFLTIDPRSVDVNVHPAKLEVRFRDSGLVHVVVEHGIRDALGGAEDGASLMRPEPLPAVAALREEVRNGEPPLRWQTGEALLAPAIGPSAPHYNVTPLFRERAVVQPPPARYESEPVSALRGRVIGQYRDSYILIDVPEGLRLVDQHVAHERVLYDRIETSGVASEVQTLLEPYIHESGAAESAALESHLDELRSVGFEIERFSGKSFAISAVPTLLGRERLPGFFRKLLDASADERGSHLARIREKVIASLACQAAIKVHRPLSGHEMSQLVAELLESSNPYACPHGRPIIVDIRHLDIERHFHRK